MPGNSIAGLRSALESDQTAVVGDPRDPGRDFAAVLGRLPLFAFVDPRPDALSGRAILKAAPGTSADLQPEGDRPVVDQCDLHVGAENAECRFRPGLLDPGFQFPEQQ